jgi:hypothetical protein
MLGVSAEVAKMGKASVVLPAALAQELEQALK